MKKSLVILIAVMLLTALVLASCTPVAPSTTSAETTAEKTGATTATGPVETTGSAGTNNGTDPITPDDSKVYVKIFKCGKADSFLVRTENSAVLIDAGEDDDYDKILAYLEEKGVTKLDYMIITQFNKNHTGSVGPILSGVEVGTILEPSYKKSSTSYTIYTQALAAAKKTAEQVTEVKTLTLDDAVLTIYPSEVTYTGTDFDEYNSLVISLSYKGNDLLFAGDVFGSRITEVMNKLEGKNFDIVKVPNHGIFDTKSESFINSLSADYAVITASDKNPADERVVSYLTAAGAKTVYITKDGAVEIRLCNGYYQIKQSEPEWTTVYKTTEGAQ